ncbi:hypothetical protein [Aliiroseovarius sp. 2305UL8-7]|uniref:hypothetical protein n=1 Tax=Aliiroseovarius conchicola TaxID=3121637 RepID=UPI0035291ECB
MRFSKYAAQFAVVMTIVATTSTTGYARESLEDPAVGNAVMTQEIIDQIYSSGTMRAAQAPLLSEICPLIVPSS